MLLLLVNYWSGGDALAPAPDRMYHPQPSVKVIVQTHFTIVKLLMVRHPLTPIRHAGMSFSIVFATVPFVKKESPGSVVATSSIELWQKML